MPIFPCFVSLSLGYGLAFLLLVLSFYRHKEKFVFLARRIVLLTWAGHTAFFVWHVSVQGFPFFVTTFDLWQLIAGGVTALFLLLASLIPRFMGMGVFVLPLVLAMNGLSLAGIHRLSASHSFFESPWALIHLFFVGLSLAVFFFCLVTGVLFLHQEQRLKNHQPTGRFFPSLDEIERAHVQTLVLGFLLYSLAALTGIIWVWEGHQGSLVLFFDKISGTFVSWIFFAVILLVRWIRGWMGRRAVIWTMAGFGVLALLLVLM